MPQRVTAGIDRGVSMTARILGATAIVGLLVLAAALAAGYVQSARFAAEAAEAGDAITSERLADLAVTTYDKVAIGEQALRRKLNSDVLLATALIDDAGGFRVDDTGRQRWAVEPDGEPLSAPRFLLGETAFSADADPETVPLVSELAAKVGVVVAVYQRLDDGRLLRVATNGLRDGRPDVGVVVEAVNADGSPTHAANALDFGSSGLVTSIEFGAWHFGAYLPIIDADERAVGVVYLGVPQASVPVLRTSLDASKVGEDGFVTVYRTRGEDRGRVAVSPGGAQDEQLQLDATDADGVAYVQRIVEGAERLNGGETASLRYLDADGRIVEAHYAYYLPWDWAIVVNAYPDEFQAAQARLEAGRRDMVLWMTVVMLAATGVGFAVSLVLARTLSGRLRGSVTEVRALADGADGLPEISRRLGRSAASTAEQAAAATRAADEVGAAVRQSTEAVREMGSSIETIARNAAEGAAVAREAVTQASTMNAAIGRLDEVGRQVGAAMSVITDIAEQTKLLALNATIEAARAGSNGQGFAVVATEVKALAEESGRSSDEILGKVAAMRSVTGEAISAIAEINGTINRIADLQLSITSAVDEQTAVTAEIGRSMELVKASAATIGGNVDAVARAAQDTAAVSGLVETAAAGLEVVASTLSTVIGGSHDAPTASAHATRSDA
ncbi:MAG: Cache 3/Cache 2 fusion domain-containing protein [Acidimicrobiia bacterium]